MQEFSYIALTTAGAEQKGTLAAETREAVTAELKARGLVPVKITAPSLLSKEIELSFVKKRPKARDMSVFCRQFVSILNAGVPVVSALEMLAAQTENKMLSGALTDIRLSVEMGESLTLAMGEHIKIFNGMFISLVSAGESSGSLPNSFERMAEQLEKDARMKAMIRKATIYPVVLLLVTIAVVAVMLGVVVPTFTEIFNELGSELPALTRAIVSMSDFMTTFWYLVVIGAFGLVAGIRWAANTVKGKYILNSVCLKLPVVKGFIIKTSSAKMARTLATLLGSGIPLIEAIETTAKTMSNVFFRDALDNAKSDVAMGTPLSETLRSSNVFPPLVYQMLSIGEESGNTEGMLERIADYYEEESEMATQQLMAMLEPAIIILMAVVVGTIIMAIMMPMAGIYSALENL